MATIMWSGAGIRLRFPGSDGRSRLTATEVILMDIVASLSFCLAITPVMVAR